MMVITLDPTPSLYYSLKPGSEQSVFQVVKCSLLFVCLFVVEFWAQGTDRVMRRDTFEQEPAKRWFGARF